MSQSVLELLEQFALPADASPLDEALALVADRTAGLVDDERHLRMLLSLRDRIRSGAGTDSKPALDEQAVRAKLR